MDNLKNNKGRLIAAVSGVVIAYFFSGYWLSAVRPTDVPYKILYIVIICILIEGSACIGEKYIDRKK